MKKRGIEQKSHLKKKNIGSHLGRSGHGLTRRVDRVLSGYCTGRSFILLRPVQPSGRLARPVRV